MGAPSGIVFLVSGVGRQNGLDITAVGQRGARGLNACQLFFIAVLGSAVVIHGLGIFFKPVMSDGRIQQAFLHGRIANITFAQGQPIFQCLAAVTQEEINPALVE